MAAPGWSGHPAGASGGWDTRMAQVIPAVATLVPCSRQSRAPQAPPGSACASCPQDHVLHACRLRELQQRCLLDALEVHPEVREHAGEHLLELVHAAVEVAPGQGLEEGPAEGALHGALDGELRAPLLQLAAREAVERAAGEGGGAGTRGRRRRQRRQLQEAGPADEVPELGVVHAAALHPRKGRREVARGAHARHHGVAAVQHQRQPAARGQRRHPLGEFRQGQQPVARTGLRLRLPWPPGPGPGQEPRGQVGRKVAGHEVRLLLLGAGSPGLLRAVAAEDEEQVVARLRVLEEPLQAREDVGLRGCAPGLSRPAVRAVQQQLELVLGVLQRVAQEALQVPDIVDAALERRVRGGVVDAHEQRLAATGAAGQRPLGHDEARHSARGRRLAALVAFREGCFAPPDRLLAVLDLSLQ
mmetsp:Transcript_48418/g.146841  ORF Transcript_48418/g.146841 Transcript_48418/m.146841 type:complete len:416 (+) Transcript_48418:141-1388(+)